MAPKQPSSARKGLAIVKAPYYQGTLKAEVKDK
jgi:hypothetical protein